MSALCVSGVVTQIGEDHRGPICDVAVTEHHYQAQRQRAAAKWGIGTLLTIRMEPADEAATHAHHKHLHGHLLTPTSDFTGYTVTELKADMKARFLPDGMTSTTEMNREQFDEFNRSVEQCIREEYPVECWERCVDAMAKSDARRVA